MNKRAKRGSGGILLFINERLQQNVEVLQTKSEDRIWIRYIELNNLDNDTFACFCYIPPKDSTAMCNYESQWNSFESEVIEFSNKGSILICGDMNARTGMLYDYVRNDSDIPIPSPLSYVIDEDELQRTSMDMSTNAQGRNLLDLCISNRLRIRNGRHNGDRQGKYTCYTSRGCSVVDYVVVSADMQCRITNFCVATLKTLPTRICIYSNFCKPIN